MGKIAVPPVFVENVAVFYVKDSFGDGFLAFYNANVYIDNLELMNSVLVDSSTSTAFHKYTLLRVNDGVIFKAPDGTDYKHYAIADFGATETTLTWDDNSFNLGSTGDTTTTFIHALRDRQTSADWANADWADIADPVMYGYKNSEVIFTVTYAAGVLQVQSVINPFCTANQIARGCVPMHVTLSPEWVDFGYNQMVVFSPINCGAVQD